MAASSQEKTEEATPKTLRDARERGQIARSQDLTGGLLLATAGAVITLQFGSVLGEFEAAAQNTWRIATQSRLTVRVLLETLRSACTSLAWAIAPILATLALASLAFSFLQVGALVTLEPLKPKLERLDPVAGFKRTFFSLNAYVELLKSLLKVLLIGALSWIVVRGDMATLLTLVRIPPTEGARHLGGTLGRLVQWVVGALLALGAIDLFYQRWRHRRDLRMTKQDVKEQRKSQQGDPQHKAKRKRLHQEILDHNSIERVPKGHVVIKNPTHIACVLRYDPDEEGAPRLLAKGEGHVALRMIEVAEEEGIPVLRNIPLARALNELEFDEIVPEELYRAVAVVLNWLQDVAHSEGRLAPWERPVEPPGAEASGSPAGEAEQGEAEEDSDEESGFGYPAP